MAGLCLGGCDRAAAEGVMLVHCAGVMGESGVTLSVLMSLR